jgi:hypothetical protein
MLTSDMNPKRQRRKHEDTEMGIKLRELQPAGEPLVYYSDE